MSTLNTMFPATSPTFRLANHSGYTSNGLAYRGFGSSFIPAAQQAIALEDWQRSEQSAENQRQFESREAKINRDWQEYMSNTAYKRAMQDIKSAGLNPVLALSQGGMSASTPSGASASGSAGSVSPHNVNDPMSDLIAGLIRLGAGLLTKK